ncbi:MAG: PAS domain-containing protein [Dongiaceae bacterium]
MERYRGIEEVPSTRARRMHRYWLGKKGGRAMPSRADLDPAEIKDLLPNVILTRLEYQPFRVLYKLIGTRAVENAGMDYSGHYLDELDFVSEFDTDWPAIYRAIADERAPIYGLCQIKFTDGVIKPYVCAMFPLSSDGERVDQVLAIEDLELDLLEVERLPPSAVVEKRD